MLFGYLEERFGIRSSIFDDYLLFRRQRSWSILRKSDHLREAGRLKVSKAGLRAFRAVGAYVKPTTRLVQAFGHEATRATLEIRGAELSALLAGKELPMSLGGLSRGYVILSLAGGQILGLGFYTESGIRSQLPKREVEGLGEGAFGFACM